MAFPIPEPGGAEDHPGTGRNGVTFAELWEHRDALQSLCRRLLGDDALAADVVQETYVRALRSLDELEPRASLMPWLATVARRQAIDVMRHRGHSVPTPAIPAEAEVDEVDLVDTVSAMDDVEQVRAALGTLTDRERQVLLLQVNEGLSLSAIAGEDGSTVASVRSVLRRARMKLREALSDTGTRVLAPVAAAVQWARRKLVALDQRLQGAGPSVVSGASERTGELLVAGVATVTVAVGGFPLPGSSADAPAAGAHSRGEAAPVLVADHSSVAGDGGAEIGGYALAALDDLEAGGTGEREPAEATPEPAPGPQPEPEDALLPGLPEPRDPTVRTPSSNPGSSAPQPAEEAEDTERRYAPEPEPEPAQPEDARITHVVRVAPRGGGSGATPVLLAAGTYLGECASDACHALFRSDDGGASWEALAAEGLREVHDLLVPRGFPTDPRIYAMGNAGLQVSRDGGATFEQAAGSHVRGPAAISPAFDDDDTILVGAAPYWRYDAGDGDADPGALTGLQGEEARLTFAPDYGDTGVLFAGSHGTNADGVATPAVFRCVDGLCGDSVTLPGMLAEPEVHVSSTFADDATIFAWQADVLYRSTDGGASYERLELPVSAEVRTLTDDGAGTVYAAVYDGADGTGGVLRSRDAGETWEVLGGGTALARGAVTVSVSGDHLVAAPHQQAGRGVYCSTDGGETWERRCAA